MFEALANWLFDPNGLTPHGFCLLWEPGLIWTHAVSDIAIGLAYFTIPLALAVLARRNRDLVFRPVFWLFAAFIVLCGVGHWLEMLTLWVPIYGLQGAVKGLTALVSVITAVMLWRLLPEALSLPSPERLRAANAALLESEGRHRANFQHSPVALHSLDDALTITNVSDSWLTLLGYRREEVVGRKISDFWPDGASGWNSGEHALLRQHGELRDVERRIVCRDGRIVEALISARLERHQGRDFIVCVVIDVTARRQAETALRASEERLHQAQKMEAVGQLTGGIAHDFNNMLQGIAGCLELMERRVLSGKPEQATRFITEARQSVDRAASLTHQMLAFARRQTLQPTAVAVDTLVQRMSDLIRRVLGPAVQLSIHLHDGVWHARCDPHQLESALLNLAINARDAMSQGGVLTITTADRLLTAADLADHDGVAEGGFIEIAVSDTGLGMPPDVMARAFEPFFTTKPIGQGTGLGLSQVYGFARQSGGLVRLDSTPGRGTTVRLYLPRDPAAHAADRPAQPPSSMVADRPGGTVLLVDDERAVRANLAEALRDAGWHVIEADAADSALKLLRAAGQVDVLVTDVGLPGMTGRQLAETVREGQPHLPVLLVTGYAGAAMVESGPGPFIDILHKPFTLAALVAKVTELHGRTGQQMVADDQ